MTKDPNPGFFIFPFFCEVGGGGGAQGRTGQGEVSAGGGGGSNYFHMLCDSLYQTNTHCFTFA